MVEPLEFLRAVWSVQGEGFGFICCRKSPTSWFDKAVKFPEQFDEFQLWDPGMGDTYFSPNLFRRPQRRREGMLASSWLYADLDLVDPRTLTGKIQPTVAWRSSGDRYQGMWLVQSLAADVHQKLNKQLTYVVKADRSGWDATQVLRLPGTLNHKYEDTPPVELMWWREKMVKVRGRGMTVGGSTVGPQLQVVTLNGRQVPAWVKSKLRAREAVGDRSRALFKIECDLLKRGFTKDEVFTLVRPSVWNKFDDRQLSDEIHRAAARVA